jgi:hypothetical protein
MAEENVARKPRAVREGETSIGDIYSLTGEHPLIGFLNPQTRTIYVAARATERVRIRFRVQESRGEFWVSEHSSLRGEYRVSPIEELDLSDLLRAGMAAVNEKSECQKFPKDKCINFYGADDSFSYSWKPAEDVFLCTWSASQDCTDIWRKVTIDEFPNKDCQGTPKSKEETIAFCNPA